MHETVELRVLAKYATEVFGESELRRLGSSIAVKVMVNRDDPRIPVIIATQNRLKGQGAFLYAGWTVARQYSRSELAAAQAFQLIPRGLGEPSGEECGTRYDDSAACPICGAGGRQVSDLVLDTRRLPRRASILRTLGGEYVVDEETAVSIKRAGLTGCELRPVRHRARFEDDPLDLRLTSAGRALLAKARAKGLVHTSLDFYWWLNEADNRPLVELAAEEQIVQAFATERATSALWFQLIVTGHVVDIHETTWCGPDPLDRESAGADACPLGHVVGSGQIAQLAIAAAVWPGTDFAITRQYLGVRRGLLRPFPLIVLSRRAMEAVTEGKERFVDIAQVVTGGSLADNIFH